MLTSLRQHNIAWFAVSSLLKRIVDGVDVGGAFDPPLTVTEVEAVARLMNLPMESEEEESRTGWSVRLIGTNGGNARGVLNRLIGNAPVTYDRPQDDEPLGRRLVFESAPGWWIYVEVREGFVAIYEPLIAVPNRTEYLGGMSRGEEAILRHNLRTAQQKYLVALRALRDRTVAVMTVEKALEER